MALTEIDRNLLKRCVAEEPGAWRDFVDRFIGLFVHVINHAAHARSVTSKPQDVDDLCAEVFLALVADDYKILRRFRGKSSLATYLTVIARRIVVREMSRRKMAEALGHVSAQGAGVERAELDAAELAATEQSRIDDMEEVEQICDRVAILCRGELVECDTPTNFVTRHALRIVKAQFEQDGKVIRESLDLDHDDQRDRLAEIIRNENCVRVHSQEFDFQDVFLKITGQAYS